MFICRSDRTNRRNGVVLSLLLPVLVSSVFLATGAPYLAHYQSRHTSVKVGRTLLWDKRIIDPDDKLYVAGYIIGVVSAGFYVIARVPQIIKNVSLFSLSLSHGALYTQKLAIMHASSSCAALWRVSLCTCSFCQSLAMSLMVWAFSSIQWMASFSFRSCPGWSAVWERWSLT